MPAMKPQMTGYGISSSKRVSRKWPMIQKNAATASDDRAVTASTAERPAEDTQSAVSSPSKCRARRLRTGI